MAFVADLVDETAAAELAAEVALFVAGGDMLALSGDLGTGKTTFARALIRHLSNDAALDVPSPSFTLVQTYETTRMPVAHIDLYRLKEAAELDELGLEELLNDHLVIIEWPEKAHERLPLDYLNICFSDDGGYRATMSGHGKAAAKLERFVIVHDFLELHGIDITQRRFLMGDASSRRYERITTVKGAWILMDMPRRKDGPPVKDNLAYSDLARLSVDITAVAAISQGLCEKGFSAPKIKAIDYDAGVALIEDFGDLVYGDIARRETVISEQMMAAVTLLADMAVMSWPDRVEPAPGRVHHIGHYDAGVLQTEADLLLEWYWPSVYRNKPEQAVVDSYHACWRGLFAQLEIEHPVWVLRDFHSPNLIWLPQRQGHARVGLIDTQDCLLGHPAYDLVSLLQDARIDVPLEVHDEQLDFYCAYRQAEDESFDVGRFRCAYAILGTQRAAKLLGIFTRLFVRDQKPAYLAHMPRVSRALERNLEHPALAELKQWFDMHLPESKRDS